jgi:hydroxymethylpyrimidine/phosphomethylpyrimidine kinase
MSNHNGHTNHANPTPPILLTIAGFDPSCGAGTAADLKTFAAHGCYGVAAITSLTVQNTQRVEDVQNTPSATLRAQLEVLVNDSDIAGVKIGMLGNRGNAAVVAEFLDAHKFAHVVHDPVMKSSSGTELLDAAGIKYVATELLKRSSVITPNIPEAEILTGMTIKDIADMEAAARKIVEMGAHAVIVKGGHMERAVDVLFDGNEIVALAGDRVRDAARNGLHVCRSDCRSTCLRASTGGGGHARESLRHQSHREELPDRQRPLAARSFLPPQDRAARARNSRSAAARFASRSRGALTRLIGTRNSGRCFFDLLARRRCALAF